MAQEQQALALKGNPREAGTVYAHTKVAQLERELLVYLLSQTRLLRVYPGVRGINTPLADLIIGRECTANGAAGGDRTHDPWLRRPILYPLSYSRMLRVQRILSAGAVMRGFARGLRLGRL